MKIDKRINWEMKIVKELTGTWRIIKGFTGKFEMSRFEVITKKETQVWRTTWMKKIRKRKREFVMKNLNFYYNSSSSLYLLFFITKFSSTILIFTSIFPLFYLIFFLELLTDTMVVAAMAINQNHISKQLSRAEKKKDFCRTM